VGKQARLVVTSMPKAVRYRERLNDQREVEHSTCTLPAGAQCGRRRQSSSCTMAPHGPACMTPTPWAPQGRAAARRSQHRQHSPTKPLGRQHLRMTKWVAYEVPGTVTGTEHCLIGKYPMSLFSIFHCCNTRLLAPQSWAECWCSRCKPAGTWVPPHEGSLCHYPLIIID
jgi:hypothetical protein